MAKTPKISYNNISPLREIGFQLSILNQLIGLNLTRQIKFSSKEEWNVLSSVIQDLMEAAQKGVEQ